MTEIGPDWRVLDGVATAWFDASLPAAAASGGRVLEVAPESAVDVRATGVRVRLGAGDHAEAVSAAAQDLGLAANPAVLQQLSVVVESPDPAAVTPFWQSVLDYESAADGGLVDPLRRDPAVRLRPSTEPRSLRNRVHLDGVRPGAVVQEVGLGAGGGPFGVRHSDADGNEVDVVPGAGLGDEIRPDQGERDRGLAGRLRRHGVLPHHIDRAAA